jgi:hypothetical protein
MKQERKKQIRLYLVKQLSRLTIWLKNKDKEPESSVISLAPRVLSKEEDLKIIQPYLTELERSLNQKDITNIAVTGAYGSGKSTIIKTFQKIHCEYEYLNVSLASFTDNDENGKKKNSKLKATDEENPIEPDKFNSNLERRLEISILQQLFYHVKPSEIPDSRFKRINNNTWLKLLLSSVGIIFWLISILLLFKFNYINKIDPSIWHTSLRFDWVAFITIIGFFTGVGFFLKHVIRLFSNSKLKKLSIKGELELGDNVDKSVFNEHLEEIIYFFERTPYNVIVIEDLDRFDTTDIFTKLRELNILLNTSNLITREINFIYAIKDELFTDKNERVKFFDYIIPIIPFINASNAGVKLNELISTRNLEDVLTSDFKQDIVSFIDDIDMRLLINIFNEFCVYREIIHVEIPDNLFAMIVYKNIYPDDFGKLSKNEGNLYSFISNKSTYINDLTNKIDNKIALKKEQIDILNKEAVTSEKILRATYINAIHELLPEALYLLNDKISFANLNHDEHFDKIKKSNNISFFYYRQNYGNLYHQDSGKSFSEIEAHVNSEYSYDERLQNITDKKNNKVEQLKHEIEILLNKKKEIEVWSIKEIFQEVEVNQHLECFSNNEMMSSLLTNGYLNEDFKDYISLFHEGNITRADDTFKRKVKSGINSPFNYQLSDKVVNLVKEIPDKYFKRSVILNFDLVDFLAENYKQHKSKYDDIITILSNEKDSSVSFIEEYIERGKNLPLFVKSICNSWDNWWDYINEEDPNNPLAKGYYYSDDRLEKYLKLIIEYAELDDIVRLNKNKDLQKFINRTSDFIFLIDKSIKDNAQKVLEKLEIKLEVLCLPDEETKSIFNYIYENHYYQINANNISLLLHHHIENIEEQKISESNYSTILNSGCKHLIDYVENNIGFYTKNVFLKLENNTKENEKSIIKLLNIGSLGILTKRDIITKQEIVITNLSEIKEIEVQKMLIGINQVAVTWRNLYQYYETLENGSDLDGVLTNYLNQENNYNQLSKQTIKEELKEVSEEVVKSFSLKIIYCNELQYNSYIKLIESVPIKKWSSIAFEKLDNDKVSWMVNTGFLSLSVSNFNKLKENFPNEHIKLIEKQQEKLVSVWDEISLSEEDILLLLKSSVIINSNKLEIIKRVDDNYIVGNKKIAKETCDLFANSTSFIELEFDVIESLIKSSSSIDNKIKILNKHIDKLTNSQFQTLVEMLGGDYPELFVKQHKPKFPNTDYNKTLFDNLEKRGLIKRHETYKDGRFRAFANY